MSDPKVQMNYYRIRSAMINMCGNKTPFSQYIDIFYSFQMIKEIKDAVTIPVFAKVRIGHFVEAQILESIGVDMIDESEGLYIFQVQPEFS